MKKRTNIYLGEEDKQNLLLLRRSYRLDSDAAAVRFAIHHVAEEVRKHVSGTPGQHRPNSPAR